jgi:hypothetical protein
MVAPGATSAKEENAAGTNIAGRIVFLPTEN